jgi:hypothetical protein
MQHSICALLVFVLSSTNGFQTMTFFSRALRSTTVMKMQRFTQLPYSLFRIQRRFPVALREYSEQMALGRTSFDLKTINGVVHPMQGDTFTTPNGMSLRPISFTQMELAQNFVGDFRVYELAEGLKLPDGLVVLHEHSDHFSLQVSEPMSLMDFNFKLTELLRNSPSFTKEEHLEFLKDTMLDQDN